MALTVSNPVIYGDAPLQLDGERWKVKFAPNSGQDVVRINATIGNTDRYLAGRDQFVDSPVITAPLNADDSKQLWVRKFESGAFTYENVATRMRITATGGEVRSYVQKPRVGTNPATQRFNEVCPPRNS